MFSECSLLNAVIVDGMKFSTKAKLLMLQPWPKLIIGRGGLVQRSSFLLCHDLFDGLVA